MNLYDKEIVRGYDFLKRKAIRCVSQGRVNESIAWVKHACTVANELNWMYHDEDLSSLMDTLSCCMVPACDTEFEPKKNRVVFYDQYGKYFILALQYLNALVEAGYEILYILSDYVPADEKTFIVDDLRLNPHIHVEVIPLSLSYSERVARIQQLTLDFAPEKIFLHVKMFSAFNLVLPSLPRTIQTYYIDLQDHAMWIKNHQIDFVMPYRVFGATIDIEKRGFRPEQVLLMPYYPIDKKSEFLGFPKETEGKVIIFTGGDFYKTINDDNAYWSLLKQILTSNPSAMVLYGGKGEEKELKKKVAAEFGDAPGIAKRFMLLPFRTDINEVFRHCDIYLATTPMSGGLMCQYAAINAKPILQFYPPQLASNNETEQVINFNGVARISYTNKEEFLKEAKRLIEDVDYRKARGEELQKNIIKYWQFNELFARTISTNVNQCAYELESINYEALVNWWLSLEHIGLFTTRNYLLSLLKKKKYIYMPLSAIKTRIKKC